VDDQHGSSEGLVSVKVISRQLYSVRGNSQKLDGGAMFGNAPKALWSRWVTVDEQNRIDLGCRALLVREQTENGTRNILFEAGIGAFFEPRLRERYGVVETEHVLLQSLKAIGISPAQIDVIVLSHLHFDHAGGILAAWQDGVAMQLAFPNAHYVVGEEAWQRALQPHPRDKASFVPGLTELIAATGRLERVTNAHSPLLGGGYRFHHSDGHTPGMLLAEIAMPAGPVVFCADLIPGTPWVHIPITMGYDRYPELLINEKRVLLDDLIHRNGRLFYTHDPKVALSGLSRDDSGKYGASAPLAELVALAS
jgi:glyoxylase-like metal-dependent hydrolase (beta-lactamase superfamily II)